MFNNCENFDCDVSNWNIRNVIYIDSAFINCLSFTGKGLDKWNPQSLKDAEGIFDNCKSIKTIQNGIYIGLNNIYTTMEGNFPPFLYSFVFNHF